MRLNKYNYSAAWDYILQLAMSYHKENNMILTIVETPVIHNWYLNCVIGRFYLSADHSIKIKIPVKNVQTG